MIRVRASPFIHLGVSFNNVGSIDPKITDKKEHVYHGIDWGTSMMRLQLLCTKLYHHLIRPKMDYRPAIVKLSDKEYKSLREARIYCLQKVYGAKQSTAMTVIDHLGNR